MSVKSTESAIEPLSDEVRHRNLAILLASKALVASCFAPGLRRPYEIFAGAIPEDSELVGVLDLDSEAAIGHKSFGSNCIAYVFASSQFRELQPGEELPELPSPQFRTFHFQSPELDAAIAIDMRSIFGTCQLDEDCPTDATTQAVGWAMLQALHRNLPESDRPLAWADLSDEQFKRVCSAAAVAIRMLDSKDGGS
jgi:hypothetical protein